METLLKFRIRISQFAKKVRRITSFSPSLGQSRTHGAGGPANLASQRVNLIFGPPLAFFKEILGKGSCGLIRL